jgi:hypothetical protein
MICHRPFLAGLFATSSAAQADEQTLRMIRILTCKRASHMSQPR